MADEDKTTIVESGEEAVEETKVAASGGKKKIIMLAGVGVGAIVVGVLLTIFVLKPMMSSDSADEGEQTEESQDAHAEKKPEKKKKAHKKPSKKDGHGEEEEASLIYSVTDIVINPAGSGGGRFLSVSFAFELDSPYMVSVFKEREPIIRDALITILSSKTVAQLTDPKQKEVVRYLIKKRISKLMDTEELAGVYYTDFVLQ